jgi:hypothetical protein
VISETDAEGKPYVPTYYQSRLYIDLSKEDILAENFEQLLRWIFNKPAYPKPQIGKPPAFLDEKAVLLPTRSRAKRAIDQLQKGSDLSSSALADYLETLSDNLESLRLDGSAEPFDQAVVDSVDAFLPYRDEFIHVVSVLARHNPNSQHMAAVKRFIERALAYYFPPSIMTSYQSHWFDNYKFIIHELFLYTVAILVKNQKFSCVDELVRGGFYLGNLSQYSHEPMQGFFILNQEQPSLDTMRNQRLSLKRNSVRAVMLNERSKGAAVDFEELMQADFVLFLRDAADAAARDSRNRWWPVTLVYAGNRSKPFEIFARGRSASYFGQTAPMLGLAGPADLMALLGRFEKEDGFYLPRWTYYSLAVRELSGAEKLGTVA